MSIKARRNQLRGREIFDQENHVFFLTFSCFKKRRLLDDDRCKRVVQETIFGQVSSKKAISCGYAIMPDRVHSAVWFPETGMSSGFMQQWKRLSSFGVKRILKETLVRYGRSFSLKDPVWQHRYYCFNIMSERKLREKVDYIHFNPVRAGLSQHPDQWMFSSFRDHQGLTAEPVGAGDHPPTV